MTGGSGEQILEVKVKECSNFTSFLSESDCVSQGLDRFPLLVWKRILENCWSWEYPEMLEFLGTVNLPGDFLSNLQMDSVRNNVVFHVLFPTLTSNYVGLGSGIVRYDEDHPSLLDFQDIHNCRLVCRAWNSAIRKNVVKHVARSHPNCRLREWESNFLWPLESRNPYANHWNWAYSNFAFTSEITKFLSYFKCGRDVNPFHCHHVSFWLFSNEYSQSIKGTEITVASATEFFAQFGKKLRLLNFNLYCGRASLAGGLYPGVFDLLKECPNLEALRLSWQCHYETESFWKSNVITGSCPELKCLTYLEADGIPHSLFNDIIRSNGGHIEKLKISGLEVGRYALLRKYALHRIPLSNLRELRIIFDCATQNDLVRLAKSAPHWTKLEKVKLDFEGGNKDPKSISWSRILQCLNQFSETVTHLWLRFPTITSELNVRRLHCFCPAKEDQLKLPNLEQIVLKFPEKSAFSLDFLCGLSKLQTLYIDDLSGSLASHRIDPLCEQEFLLREYLNSRGPQKIRLSRDLKYSKIWEEFPQLSKLYWRQIDKKCAWKKVKGKARAEQTAWTLHDFFEGIPEYWTNLWARLRRARLDYAANLHMNDELI